MPSNLRRLIRTSALALAVALPAAADWSEIQARGTLRVLMVNDPSSATFFNLDTTSEKKGFDVEILQGFAALHRLKLERVLVAEWPDLVPELLAGRGDLIAGQVTATAARREKAAFTQEVFPSRTVILTRKPTPRVTSLEQLRGMKVGTVKGTSMAEALASALGPKGFDDSIATGSVVDAIRSGRLQAGAWGLEDAIRERAKDPELELGIFVGPPDSLAYGARKTDARLLSELDGYISNMRRTPTWSRLVVKYFGEEALLILKRARDEK